MTITQTASVVSPAHSRGAIRMERLWSQAGATGGNRSQMERG
jgi:hypothetical protein